MRKYNNIKPKPGSYLLGEKKRKEKKKDKKRDKIR